MAEHATAIAGIVYLYVPFSHPVMPKLSEMNLAPLTSRHGYPVRAIIPGLYGMMNQKWITEIEVVDNV